MEVGDPSFGIGDEVVGRSPPGDQISAVVDIFGAFDDALSREDSGKIFKHKLREPYWAGRETRI